MLLYLLGLFMGINRDIKEVFELKAKVYSFDVFDTVLTRVTGSPLGIFHLMQNKLRDTNLNVPHPLKHRFCELRLSAEKEARRYIKLECDIADIYKTLAEKHNLSSPVCNFLIKQEIELELASVRPVPQIIEILQFLYSHNTRVIFISDTYLFKEVIQRMLIKVGAYRQGDKIYVSNEHMITKKSGRLFNYVLKEEKCLPVQMLHIGDNLRSDVISGQKIGIKCIHFQEAHLNRYEKTLLNSRWDPFVSNPISDSIAGASHLARLSFSTPSKLVKTLHSLGANLAAPILSGFVIWILQEAQKRNVKRLYFAARDGQVILEIARRVKEHIDYDIELRYLYCSRQAWVLPSVTEITEKEVNWMLMKKPILSIVNISERTGLDPQVIQAELKKRVGKTVNIDHNLDDDINELRNILKSPIISKMVLAGAEEQRSKIIKYFQQEGLFEDIPFGIVDLGWLGTMQDSLKRILVLSGRFNERVSYGFYFGVNPSHNEKVNSNIKLGYYFSPDTSQRFCPVDWVAMKIMEIFTTGDHGLTLSYYQDQDGIWLPKLKKSRNEDALSWGLEHLRSGIFDFLRFLPEHSFRDIFATNSDYFKETATRLLFSLTNNPTKEEVIALGDYSFKADPVETYSLKFAPPFSLTDAFQYWLRKDKDSLTNWVKATYIRSDFRARCVIYSFLFSPKSLIRRTLYLKQQLNIQTIKRYLRKFMWKISNYM